jgi:hypothetical protein
MDLDSDEFFDPRIRNVIVLDDLMSTTTKNPRINDLFTEGSHHRILTVISLNQNLYFDKDPTQRRRWRRISTIVYMSVLVMAVAVVMVDIHDGSLTAG